MTLTIRRVGPAAVALCALMAGCSGLGGAGEELPQLAEATGATLNSCEALTGFAFAETSIATAATVADGTLKVGGRPVAAHCRVTGAMFQRVSPVDGNRYAIGFEMRLPRDWNGRFFYQANGGIDGAVVPATGAAGGSAPLTSALNLGFAVISSDAGHAASLGPFFGRDPQARLDYGYQAVSKLTPMAKALIRSAYGKAPDRSYFGGCSNGGRHAMVAATRYADQYDGFLVGDPGYRLPLAAIANIAAFQGYASVATNPADPSTGYTPAEQALVARSVLARCDALDGVADGLVQDGKACQAAFDLDRDVPTCSGPRNGSCLSTAQKAVIGKRFAGVTDSGGRRFYSSWPYDAGIGSGNTASWNFMAPPQRDSGAVAFIWQVPPADRAGFNGLDFVLKTSPDAMLASVNATDATYRESAMSFMLPPRPAEMGTLKQRGGKIMVYHGTSDPIFSSDDTAAWYRALDAANGGRAERFARYYPVPGMTHCQDGPATDQFDMLSPLVAWVEQGKAPGSVTAAARGPGNPAGANAGVPADWSPTRTRPLCPFPTVARYNGSGDIESAAAFSCR